ncbi:MAG: flagellar basal body-associated FliL family protein [Alphaproteobacteria bacterium]|jgi:flagellar FliL protein|uniref:Flagellar protein FliL n=1 Tax=Brevundimonas mediterranea TaxID=74329 RepID=A0A7Z9C5M4_9CAUL|nr:MULTISPECIES: flagellar basal body-associated FliL family protein [Brevundimonas]MBU1271272.1 flagellar basal body-associated FliL family protein [Alphaproteobacteria bacterium]OGN46123.1 MAG: flagellar basal body protein FliL [Caulobacterales bacterium RIFCSPHIGHO2_01_FULL_67_30]OGN48332.1 MAG: flagellar basal body protein FliL [Caulobacterales bacterium RIFCSPHIGHO2_12_FULL_68_13]OGN61267.1 MAG: flagellar basal body protein FliL [Caulobacterales bacterium RIFOXYA1_FULL_67_7]KDP93928.1 fla
MFKFGKKKGDPNADAPADKSVDADAAEGEEGAPKKKKLPILFIIAPVALLVLGGGGAAAFFLMKPKPAEAHGEEAAAAGHGEEKAEEKGGHGKEEKKAEGGGHGAPAEGGEADPALGKISEGPDGVTFYTLPDMVMNIQSADGRPTFLKLKLTLEMHDAEVATHLQSEMPRLQDMFTGFVRELRPEDLSGSAGTYQLRAEILRRVNLVAAPGKVDAVLIEEMLVQ